MDAADYINTMVLIWIIQMYLIPSDLPLLEIRETKMQVMDRLHVPTTSFPNSGPQFSEGPQDYAP